MWADLVSIDLCHCFQKTTSVKLHPVVSSLMSKTPFFVVQIPYVYVCMHSFAIPSENHCDSLIR